MKENIFKHSQNEFIYRDTTLTNKFYVVSDLEHRHIQELHHKHGNVLPDEIIHVRDMIKTDEVTRDNQILDVYEIISQKRSGIFVNRLMKEPTYQTS